MFLGDVGLDMYSKRSLGRIPVVIGFLMLFLLGAFLQVRATTDNAQLELIEFSSYLGGTDDESMGVSFAYGDILVDSKGNIILVGMSYSDDFPTKNAIQEHLNGGRDGIIAKFSPNGSLIFSTYLGGLAQEYIAGVAVDSEDNIILAGETASLDFPIVNSNPSDSLGLDCFITKISEDGQSILFSTKFGGSDSDYLYAMCIDSNDRIAITGTTASSDFPLLYPSQSSPKGNLEVFLSFFDSDGYSLLFSTYLGTSGIDHGRQVAFDSHGDLLLTGMIANGDLGTDGVFQEEYAGGSSDAFVAKFKANGTLVYFTFLGGTDLDTANDMAIDSADNVVVTGYSLSDDYPLLNPIQAERIDRAEMFITKLSSDGQEVEFSSYLGGSAADYGNAIKIDQEDRIVVIGQSASLDFPMTYTVNITESRYDNIVLVVLNPDGSLLFSTQFGGMRDDYGMGVAWYSNDSIVLTGCTASPDFPIHSAYQDTHSGSNDMFIMKVNLEGLLDAPLSFGIVEAGIIVGVIGILVVVLLLRRRIGK